MTMALPCLQGKRRSREKEYLDNIWALNMLYFMNDKSRMNAGCNDYGSYRCGFIEMKARRGQYITSQSPASNPF